MDGVGCHIPWTLAEFGEFAVGGSGFDVRFGLPFRGLKRVVCTAALLLLFVGGLRELTRQSGLFVIAALIVLSALFAFFTCCRLDPWTGATGHTWNLFKIAKWTYPFVSALQIAGLARIVCTQRRWNPTEIDSFLSAGGTVRKPTREKIVIGFVLTLLGTVALLNAQQLYRASRGIAKQCRDITANESPYSAMHGLRDRLADSNDPIYFVRAPETDFKSSLIVSLLYPRPLVNGWHGDQLYGTLGLLADRPRAFDAGTIYLCHGEPPFDAPLERLPFDLWRLDSDRPTVFQINYPDRPFASKVDPVLRITGNPLTCWIFAARCGVAELQVECTDGSVLPTNVLFMSVNDGAPIDALKSPLVLRRGVNRVVLTALSNEIHLNEAQVNWRRDQP
jgi:hypothetical protein